MPERLRRLDETFLQLPIYFVTACTHKREPCLNNLDIHQRFTEFGKAGEERGAWLGALVLMPDHLHAFVIIDDERLFRSHFAERRLVLRKMGVRSRESRTSETGHGLERLAV